MAKKIVLGLLVVSICLYGVLWWFNQTFMGIGVEGLYKVHGCYRDDELGVTYQISNTFKGQTFAKVLISDKYPSQESYKLGAEQHWPSTENKQKRYPVPCP